MNMQEFLDGSNIPRALAKKAITDPVLLEKLKKVQEMLKMGVKKFALVGAESEYKDMFAYAILYYLFFTHHRTVRWYMVGKDTELDPAYACYFSGMDMLKSKFNQTIYESYLRNAILNDRVVIIGCNSLQTLEDAFGAVLVDYISHGLVSVDVGCKREPNITI